VKLVEIAYFTDNVAEMAGFYRHLFGVEPVAQSDGMAIFLVGETKLFIHRAYKPEANELPPENHVAFAVPDIDATCRELIAGGLTLEVAPRDYYWGRSAYLRDADGHLIEIIQSES
jgi:catechol 2,3-dioxygenase-like lactoylglutathione lyase family enzyme